MWKWKWIWVVLMAAEVVPAVGRDSDGGWGFDFWALWGLGLDFVGMVRSWVGYFAYHMAKHL